MKKRPILMTAILLGSILLFVQGCAPTIKIAPVKPSISESDFELALKNVDLVYESIPGEVLKYNLYFSSDFNIKEPVGVKLPEIEQIKKEIEKLKGSLSFSGELEVTTERVSLTKDISSKSSMKFKSGKAGDKMKSFHRVISNKGKILYSDSDELWGTGSFKFFPDYPINVGNQWNDPIEADIKEFGKVQFSVESELVGFKLVEGRPCAKIITEVKPSTPIWIQEIFFNLKITFTDYHDLKIGQSAYSEVILSIYNEPLKEIPIIMKLKSRGISKLNYQNSIFKRPIN